MSATFAPPISPSPVPQDCPPGDSPIRRQIPSQRNREVFAAVVLGKSHEKVAEEFHLSQPRVTQIVQQVREWTVQVNRGEDYGYNEIQQLRLAEATLRIQLDGWMRMAMQEWDKSCKQAYGRATFLGQASRLATQSAKLAGVDVTGKTARALAQQQAHEEARRRSAAAQKPLWKAEPKSPPATEQGAAPAASTPFLEKTYAAEQLQIRPSTLPLVEEKNSYGFAASAAVSNLAESVKNRASMPGSMTSPSPPDKPIPKFLDKKVRKRLLAIRRHEARSETLSWGSP